MTAAVDERAANTLESEETSSPTRRTQGTIIKVHADNDDNNAQLQRESSMSQQQQPTNRASIVTVEEDISNPMFGRTSSGGVAAGATTRHSQLFDEDTAAVPLPPAPPAACYMMKPGSLDNDQTSVIKTLAKIKRFWKRKYVWIEDGALHYHDKPGKTPERTISFHEIVVVMAVNREIMRREGADEKYWERGWALRTKNRAFIWACENSVLRDEWVTYLLNARQQTLVGKKLEENDLMDQLYGDSIRMSRGSTGLNDSTSYARNAFSGLSFDASPRDSRGPGSPPSQRMSFAAGSSPLDGGTRQLSVVRQTNAGDEDDTDAPAHRNRTFSPTDAEGAVPFPHANNKTETASSPRRDRKTGGGSSTPPLVLSPEMKPEEKVRALLMPPSAASEQKKAQTPRPEMPELSQETKKAMATATPEKQRRSKTPPPHEPSPLVMNANAEVCNSIQKMNEKPMEEQRALQLSAAKSAKKENNSSTAARGQQNGAIAAKKPSQPDSTTKTQLIFNRSQQQQDQQPTNSNPKSTPLFTSPQTKSSQNNNNLSTLPTTNQTLGGFPAMDDDEDDAIDFTVLRADGGVQFEGTVAAADIGEGPSGYADFPQDTHATLARQDDEPLVDSMRHRPNNNKSAADGATGDAIISFNRKAASFQLQEQHQPPPGIMKRTGSEQITSDNKQVRLNTDSMGRMISETRDEEHLDLSHRNDVNFDFLLPEELRKHRNGFHHHHAKDENPPPPIFCLYSNTDRVFFSHFTNRKRFMMSHRASGKDPQVFGIPMTNHALKPWVPKDRAGHCLLRKHHDAIARLMQRHDEDEDVSPICIGPLAGGYEKKRGHVALPLDGLQRFALELRRWKRPHAPQGQQGGALDWLTGGHHHTPNMQWLALVDYEGLTVQHDGEVDATICGNLTSIRRVVGDLLGDNDGEGDDGLSASRMGTARATPNDQQGGLKGSVTNKSLFPINNQTFKPTDMVSMAGTVVALPSDGVTIVVETTQRRMVLLDVNIPNQSDALLHAVTSIKL